MAGERYEAAKPVLALLCVAATLYALYSLYGAVIYVAAVPARTMALEGIGSVVSITLVAVLGATMDLTGVAVEQVGEFLESSLDPLAFEIGIGIRQRPDQPVAFVADRRIGQDARHRR